MKLPLIFIVLIVLPSVSASVIINEIMYDPEDIDINHEWIEIYNNGNEEIDLIGWKLYRHNENVSHGLNLTQGDDMTILSNEYIVIVKDTETFLEDYPNYTGKILRSPFDLENYGGLLAITSSNKKIFDAIIDILFYYPQQGGNDNGMSLCRINNLWKECIPTPGNENLEVHDHFTLKINEFLPDPIGYDDASIPDGEWVELYNFGDYYINLKNLTLNDNYGRGMNI